MWPGARGYGRSMTENQLPTSDERAEADRGAGTDRRPEHRTDRVDPTAAGLDVDPVEHEIEGSGRVVDPSRD